MTLGTLLLAFALVGVLFVLSVRFVEGRALTRGLLMAVLAESLVLTLVAGLWFGSLGHGGWLLLFGLLGVLVNGAERAVRVAVTPPPHGAEIRGFVLGLVRYIAAGALLAWRLG